MVMVESLTGFSAMGRWLVACADEHVLLYVYHYCT